MKQATKKRMKWVLVAWLAALYTLLGSSAVFAANKAVQVSASFGKRVAASKQTETWWNQQSYVVQTQLSKTSKLKKWNEISAKIYVPTSMFKADGDDLIVYFTLPFGKAGSGDPIGETQSVDQFHLIRAKGKVTLQRWKADGSKQVKNGSVASLKKSGKYYVVTIKAERFASSYFAYDTGKTKALNKKTTYDLMPLVVFAGDFKKATKGTILLDQISLRTTRTQTVTYNKADYEALYVYNINQILTKNKTMKVKRVAVK